MSKGIDKFFQKVTRNFDVANKLAGDTTAGNRILPPRSKKNDASYGLRLDAGEVVDGKRNVYLQVNSSVESPGLKNWLQKNGAHANLASAAFDTKAKDKEIEVTRVLEALEAEAKEKI